MVVVETGMVTSVIAVLLKAYKPMVWIEEPRLADVRDVHCAKA